MARLDAGELRQYVRDSLEILGTSLDFARDRQPIFYRVVAVQLRLLLCDTTRLHGRMVDTSLLPAVWPGIKLMPPLGMKASDFPGVPIDLPDWLGLEIPILVKPTIRRLICKVCDQDGGVHVDRRVNIAEHDPVEARAWIVRIGETVLEQIKL